MAQPGNQPATSLLTRLVTTLLNSASLRGRGTWSAYRRVERWTHGSAPIVAAGRPRRAG
ncbi:hypothetical protein BTZ20_2938 [Rhodococcus sp. MTM3W5.2]|nr:hypothetical protein BTZ20_2938 [Rhodococcus sp. MTM3W5.2]